MNRIEHWSKTVAARILEVAGMLTVLTTANLASAQLPELALPSTVSGNTTTAKFFGGATADEGSSYGASFQADLPIDVVTEIQVEPTHVNTLGKLYVIIGLADEYFMLTETGEYLPWDLNGATLQPAATKQLAASEPITIVDNVAFGPAGVADAVLTLFLAYDTAATPGELYYSGAPLVFAIESDGPAPSYSLFVNTVSSPIIQTRCILCHTSTGLASSSALIYLDSSQPDFQMSNYNTLLNYIENIPNGSDLILSKPQGLTIHGGGVQLAPATPELASWQAFVAAVEAELASSGSGGSGTDIFALVFNTSNEETLRKASILFAGRVPTDTELTNIANASDTELRQAIRNLMSGDGFHNFLIEGANDRLLTRAFAGNLFAIVNRYYYPDSMQYFMSQGNRAERALVGAALADEPLELIAHVVMNERSYTEVLTADYIMVNPYSAKVYGGNVVFDDPTDTDEWREGEITEYYRCTVCNPNSPLASWNIPTEYPHAGILNSPAFLARFPSTATNRNRARSRWAYYFFLGVDIEGLAERTTDQAALSDENNPTLNNENCTVCHDTMDPVAGAFQNYSDDGFYKARPGGLHSLPPSYTNNPSSGYQNGDTWYADMLAPGFKSELAPNPDNSIQWLAQEFVNDTRFGYGTVHFWYPAVMGKAPYALPENPEDADYPSKLAAYSAEQELIQTVAADFVSGAAGHGSHNLKDLLVDLAMSDHFRANTVVEMTDTQLIELEEIGTGKLLTPEQLNRKLTDITGFEWEYGNANALTQVYSLVYGGIDSFGITARATELTTLMSTVVVAMANEASCSIVNNDFSKPIGARKMFVNVELNTLPTSNPSAIRSNIQHLHQLFLGEDLASNDPEIDATFALFNSVWQARLAAGKSQAVSSTTELCIFENVEAPIQVDPNQTLRSWAAVVNYLMRDYKFIYE